MSFENLKLEWRKKIEKSIENIESMISDEEIDKKLSSIRKSKP